MNRKLTTIAAALLSIHATTSLAGTNETIITNYRVYNPPLNVYTNGMKQDFDQIDWSNYLSVFYGSLHVDTEKRAELLFHSNELKFLNELKDSDDAIWDDLATVRSRSQEVYLDRSFVFKGLDGNEVAILILHSQKLHGDIVVENVLVKENDKWKIIMSLDKYTKELSMFSSLRNDFTWKNIPQSPEYFENQLKQIREKINTN